MAIGVCLATTDTQAHLVESIRNRHFLESGFCKSWNVYRLLQVIQVKLDQLATLEHVETFLRIEPVDPVAPQIREGREYFLTEIKYYLSQGTKLIRSLSINCKVSQSNTLCLN